MNTFNSSGISQLDIDLLEFFFNSKSAMLEEIEEHKSGMFSTQNKILELKRQLLTFVKSYKNKNSLFFLFFNDDDEQNLKVVASSVLDEPNELTKRFAIILDENTLELEVKQLSLSTKIINS